MLKKCVVVVYKVVKCCGGIHTVVKGRPICAASFDFVSFEAVEGLCLLYRSRYAMLWIENYKMKTRRGTSCCNYKKFSISSWTLWSAYFLKYIPPFIFHMYFPCEDNAICLHDSFKYKHCSLQSKLLYTSLSAEATALFAFASYCKKKKLVQPHESNT